MDSELNSLAIQVGELLLNKQKYLVTAESCTGGWIAQTITSISGSSKWFDRGFVSYSNASKVDMLNVSETILQQHGAVSAATAEAMAVGALKASQASISVAVTGVAGPDGGTPQKPVGTVWFGYAYYDAAGKPVVLNEHHLFRGDRFSIRRETVIRVLKKLIELLSQSS